MTAAIRDKRGRLEAELPSTRLCFEEVQDPKMLLERKCFVCCKPRAESILSSSIQSMTSQLERAIILPNSLEQSTQPTAPLRRSPHRMWVTRMGQQVPEPGGLDCSLTFTTSSATACWKRLVFMLESSCPVLSMGCMHDASGREKKRYCYHIPHSSHDNTCSEVRL